MPANQNSQNTSGDAQPRTLAEARSETARLQRKAKILAILLGIAVGIIAALVALMIFMAGHASTVATSAGVGGTFLAATYFALFLEEKAGVL
ncbi:hypothetical protein ACFVYV_47000 [Streptomyces mirabilis]|uniref:hypothetical protein n=1 Tax=Streptomyces mirabilis TaxID=68239 RepID=UPI0036DCC7EE